MFVITQIFEFNNEKTILYYCGSYHKKYIFLPTFQSAVKFRKKEKAEQKINNIKETIKCSIKEI